jgi:hypothetical protein
MAKEMPTVATVPLKTRGCSTWGNRTLDTFQHLIICGEMGKDRHRKPRLDDVSAHITARNDKGSLYRVCQMMDIPGRVGATYSHYHVR